jgi:hypothetical protein
MCCQVRAGSYNSAAELYADVKQLADNSKAYNTPGVGRFGSAWFIPQAEALLQECKRRLEDVEFAQAASFWQAIMEVRRDDFGCEMSVGFHPR